MRERKENETLKRLFEDDQAEHAEHPEADSVAFGLMRKRDARRRAEVKAMVMEGGIRHPADYYRAGMIMQHGEAVSEVEQAHELAALAARHGHEEAKWLAAASHDRLLMIQGKPQKYGTQIVPDGNRFRLWDVEPGVSDEERQEWNVPPLAEMESRAAKLTEHVPQPDMKRAPEWLHEAIERWKKNEQ